MSNHNEDIFPNKRTTRENNSDIPEPEKRVKQTQTADRDLSDQEIQSHTIVVREYNEHESEDSDVSDLEAEIEDYLQFKRRDQGLLTPSYSENEEEDAIEGLPINQLEFSEEELLENA